MNDSLRHLLATIAYRFNKSVQFANGNFPMLDIGHGVRKPIEILHHMNHVLSYAKHLITSEERVKQTLKSWTAEVELFKNQLAMIDQLATTSNIERALTDRLIQGPLSDVLTHIGQLSMLSRINAHPIPPENFSIAPISKGINGK